LHQARRLRDESFVRIAPFARRIIRAYRAVCATNHSCVSRRLRDESTKRKTVNLHEIDRFPNLSRAITRVADVERWFRCGADQR
jgi:hypothetical protein